MWIIALANFPSISYIATSYGRLFYLIGHVIYVTVAVTLGVPKFHP